MKATILMTSVAAAALAAPAFAAPDRYEQGHSCTGMGSHCIQEQMRLEDGNRLDEKPGNAAAINGSDQDGTPSGTLSASRGEDDDSFANEAGDVAHDTGDEVSLAADEAGDEISNAAEDVGDEVGGAADDVGDAVSDVFD
jgi:hypothetical protein